MHFAHAIYFHRNGWHRGTGDGLDIGLQEIVAGDSTYCAIVGHTKQYHPADCVGEGANLSPEFGGHDPLELGGEAFTEGDESIELFFGCIHCNPSPTIGIISACVIG